MRKKLREKDLIIVFYSLIILVLMVLFLSVFNGEKTGKAWTIENNKFEEDFESLTSPWEGDVELGGIFEEFWNKEYKVAKLDSSSGLKIRLSDTKVSEDNGMIWFRIKLDEDFDDTGFLPIMTIGDGIGFFITETTCPLGQEGCIPSLTNGNNVYGASSVVTIVGPKTGDVQLEANKWYEFLFVWEYNQDDDGCNDPGKGFFSGKSNYINVYLDDYSEPVLSLGNCVEDGTVFDVNDYIYILPDLSILPERLIDDSAIVKSGFSIEGLITSDDNIMPDRSLNSIVSNEVTGTYFSNLNKAPNITNPSMGFVVQSDIVDICKIWNNPELRGDISIEKIDTAMDVDLEIDENDNLVISNIASGLETRARFKMECILGDSKTDKIIYVTLGDPIIIEFDINEEIISIDQNIVDYISYNITYLGEEIGPFNDLSYTISGDNIVEVNIERGRKRIQIQALDQAGEEEITLTVTDILGISVSDQFRVKVMGDNVAPDIGSCSASSTTCNPADGNHEIEQGEKILFKQRVQDDRQSDDELSYQWFVDSSLMSTSQNYEFSTTANTLSKDYRVELEVMDRNGDSTSKVWIVTVTEKTAANASEVNDSNVYQPGAQQVCGNNILETNEQCDGTDKSACGIYNCFSNCSCYSPPGSANTNNVNNNPDENQGDVTTQQTNNNQNNNGGQITQQTNLINGGTNNPTGQEAQTKDEEDKGGLLSLKKQEKDNENNIDDKKKGRETTGREKMEMGSPGNVLINTLLWILGGLLVVPFIIIAVSKISKPKQEQKMAQPKIQGKDIHQYNNKKLVDIVNWYKVKGANSDYTYNMLLRMGFDKDHAYKAIYDTFYKK